MRRWLLRTLALMAAAAVLGYVAHLVVRHTVDPNLPRVKRAGDGIVIELPERDGDD